MDKRILTGQFLLYTNINLKLFSLLSEISFFKKMVPGRTNSQGLKITEENVLPCQEMDRHSSLLGRSCLLLLLISQFGFAGDVKEPTHEITVMRSALFTGNWGVWPCHC